MRALAFSGLSAVAMRRAAFLRSLLASSALGRQPSQYDGRAICLVAIAMNVMLHIWHWQVTVYLRSDLGTGPSDSLHLREHARCVKR